MKTLYIECNMGASGDMISSALFELLSENEQKIFFEKFNSLKIKGVRLTAQKSIKCGIQGTHFCIQVDGMQEGENVPHSHAHTTENAHSHCSETIAHNHTTLFDIQKIVETLNTTNKVKKNILAIYDSIAQAESKVHGKPVEQIHFHEVGSIDAICDITSACLLFDMIGATKIICSPINVGSGTVCCAHGILPVPAPATALLLQNIPFYTSQIQSELCTPTGAALLRHFVNEFKTQNIYVTTKIGYGMGTKDFDVCNALRIFLCNDIFQNKNNDFVTQRCNKNSYNDEVVELFCNIDDMTAEQISFASERLLENGALDVYTTCIQMKKNRPGIILTCLCNVEQKQKFIELIFANTTTLGLREATFSRYILRRSVETQQTDYGKVHLKKASGFGIEKTKYEYEDIAKIAREKNITFFEAEKLLQENHINKNGYNKN